MLYKEYQLCTKACNECIVECNRCATACLHEDSVKELRHCIQLDEDCAAICAIAVKLMLRDSKFAEKFCALCAEICQACGDECKKHAQMEHCKRCADACYRCAEACRTIAKV